MPGKDLAHLRVETLEDGERSPPHPGGNAECYQKKGLAGKAIRKTMKTKGRQNRCIAKTRGASEERRDGKGTLSAEPYAEVTIFVTICQVKT